MKHFFVLFSFLKDIFAKYKILSPHFFSFSTLKVLLHYLVYLVAFRASNKMSTDIVICCFSAFFQDFHFGFQQFDC